MKYFRYTPPSFLALASLFAMGLAVEAVAAPKINGRLYASMLYQDTKKTETNLSDASQPVIETNNDRTNFSSSGSRIWLSGSEQLNDKLDLVYHLEYSVFLDNDGAGRNFGARNTYLGVKHKEYGQLHFGRMYTPDDAIDYVAQGYLYADGSGNSFGYHGQRTNNSIRYMSPGFGKDKKNSVRLHYAMDEGGDTLESAARVRAFKDGKPADKYRDLFVANILHNGDKLKLGAAYTYGGDFSAVRGMVSYAVNDKLTVGALAQQVDYGSGDNELGATVSAYYQYDKNKLDFYGQVSRTDNYGGFKDGEKTTASIGAVKWLKKESGARVRAFASLNYADATVFGYKADNLTKTQSESFGVETGLRYDF
ncbi:Outer membrane protein (porin) [Moraxella cuniculi DSM 21768]|uniref:Outer membrane protein (Porin) n=1 Tax=Moraxella cuniculi DSM 21768 TaxID=1122245 RepID=A0A1N7DTU9_9GAMM|nr:porin [Moraxella cuniculi]SIR79240.1 Outer membrane protein (porin) [Moraxella cuniculi DSM 21768]